MSRFSGMSDIAQFIPRGRNRAGSHRPRGGRRLESFVPRAVYRGREPDRISAWRRPCSATRRSSGALLQRLGERLAIGVRGPAAISANAFCESHTSLECVQRSLGDVLALSATVRSLSAVRSVGRLRAFLLTGRSARVTVDVEVRVDAGPDVYLLESEAWLRAAPLGWFPSPRREDGRRPPPRRPRCPCRRAGCGSGSSIELMGSTSRGLPPNRLQHEALHVGQSWSSPGRRRRGTHSDPGACHSIRYALGWTVCPTSNESRRNHRPRVRNRRRQ